MAHQQMGQIGDNLMREILGNVGTVVAFQVGATDARRLSRMRLSPICPICWCAIIRAPLTFP